MASGAWGAITAFAAFVTIGCTSVEQTASNSTPAKRIYTNESIKEFVARVIGDTEDVWGRQFPAMGWGSYRPVWIVLVTRTARTGCGTIDVAPAPYFCPPDGRIYVDPTLFRDVANRDGDTVAAYLLAREVGRHVQATRAPVASDSGSKRTSESQARLELQAECFAGVWVHAVRERNLLEPGDLEVVVGASASDTYALGGSNSGALRARASKAGLANGNPRDCN